MEMEIDDDPERSRWVHYSVTGQNMSFDLFFHSSRYTRKVDDVRAMVKMAKLRENHLTDVTQVVYYGETDASPDWRLLELNENLLKAIEDGKELSFKG